MLKDLIVKGATTLHRFIYDKSDGRFLGEASGMSVLKLTTTGRKSGEQRVTMLTTPLVKDGKVYVVASYGGDDRHPAWFLNLQAEPNVRVERDGTEQAMTARVASGEERQTLWDEIGSAHRNYVGYQAKTERQIPVVELAPV